MSGEGRKDTERAPVSILAEIKLGSGDWQKARVCDLSCRGFRVDWLPAPSAHSSVYLRIPGLEAIPASVRWRNDRAIGCRFERPLSPYVFEHIVRVAGSR